MDTNAVVKLVEKYISIWNELDDKARRDTIDDIFTPNAVYIDPTVEADGVAAIDQYIADSQKNFTGMKFSFGAVLNHHEAVHFSWEVGPSGGAPAVSGFDVALFERGRISRVYGFFNVS